MSTGRIQDLSHQEQSTSQHPSSSCFVPHHDQLASNHRSRTLINCCRVCKAITSILDRLFSITLSNSAISSDAKSITYQYQDSLPHLPVPEIESTAHKYFRSVLPLFSPQEPHSPSASDVTPTPAYNHTKACVKEFLTSPLVKELQGRLKKRAEEEGCDNWLSDLYNEWSFMGYREPVIPFSCYYIVHKPDHSRMSGVKRASGLVRAIMEFRNLLETKQLEPDFGRSGPLCMNSYRWLFNSCRYPCKPSDTAKKFDPLVNNHLAVIRKGKFFEFPVIKPNGSYLSEAELETQFEKVIELAGPNETPFPLGALTTQDRDTWADTRVEICYSDNCESLKRIESSIICVALDDTSPMTIDEASDARILIGFTIWAGGCKNRFFDKQQCNLGLIVCENGQSGFNAEHSCMDAPAVARMNDWMLDVLANKKIHPGTSCDTNLPPPCPIEFVLSDVTKQNIVRAISKFEERMSPHSLHVLEYNGCGARAIKSRFKLPPDAVAQLVFQLGYYKLFGRVPVTWEPAQTRKFKLGRTEVIRSCTIEALEFCKTMENGRADHWRERLEKFRRAVKTHLKNAKEASDGQGVDRHLLGKSDSILFSYGPNLLTINFTLAAQWGNPPSIALQLCLKPGEERPALFRDPMYKESTYWNLSTSNLPSEHFNGFSYGSITPEGFGLGYSVDKESMRFSITTPTGNGARLKNSLQAAADEILRLMNFDEGDDSSSAKL
ncbi:hypothetical protein VP01_2601g1 [Puccinia sorghi]|uniref:Carnitine O-acetyltransferase, mitochondrial n=1 Tax=Puccinia sorghi TaxID=27349 RepID=A0A0L6V589_9BASI|nr:hypothetical protein VP01_2601g1 [Puccinia sorghi]